MNKPYSPDEQKVTIIVEEGLSGAFQALRDAFIRFIDELTQVIARTLKAVQKIYQIYLEGLKKLEEHARKKAAHKLDVSRPRIVHQVMCRKPKLIRKIIR